MGKKLNITIFIFLLLTLSLQCLAAGLKAKIDSHQIAVGQSFNLTLATHQNTSTSPDLRVLEKSFYIFGQSKGVSISSINGKTSMKKYWIITLMPKHKGKIIIPSIHAGSLSSKPISITVSKKTAQNKRLQHAKEIFLKESIHPLTAYVQGQVLYTVKLYSKVFFTNARLTSPVADDANIQPLGRSLQYQATVDGDLYQVVEQRFVLFPQKSGELTIKPPVFTAYVDKNNSASMPPSYRRFFNNPFGSPIKITGRKIKLNVHAIPANISVDQWLPAKNIKLEQTWSKPLSSVHVGEPITRTITIYGEGVTAEQLPNVGSANIAGINVYPDQPKLKNTTSEKGIVGVRQVKIAMIPNNAGNISLPAIKVHWFNTATGKKQVASLGAQVLHVMPTIGQAKNLTPAAKMQHFQQAATSQNTPTSAAVTKPPIVKEKVKTKIVDVYSNWPWIVAVIFALLWLLTMMIWLRSKRKNKTKSASKPVVEKTSRATIRHKAVKAIENIQAACEEHDVDKLQKALLFWGRNQWPEVTLTNIGDIKHFIKSKELNSFIDQLNRLRYYPEEKTDFDFQAFYKIFVDVHTELQSNDEDDANDLPPLNLLQD